MDSNGAIGIKQRFPGIVDRLEGLQSSGSEYSARCPAHDDQVASLTFGLGDDGRLLLCCQANCETKDIVKALNCKMRDLFPSNGARKKIKAKGGRGRPKGK